MIFDPVTIKRLEEKAATYKRPGFTEEEDEFLKTWWLRVPIGYLEEAMHHSAPTLDKEAARLGLPPRRQV